MMRVGSLFSGVGLGDYGLELAGMEIVFQVEIDPFCQKILRLRWPDVPKWIDIKEVATDELPEVDVLAGGFPCQPVSHAGKRRGVDDHRWLWPEMLRIIQGVKPPCVIIENVPGLISMGIETVLTDLEASGYETLPPIVFPAHALGADHKRDRVWIIAYTIGEHGHACGYAASKILQCRSAPPEVPRLRSWDAQSGIPRVANVGPSQLDRLKALGNGQMVSCAQFVAERVIEFDEAQG